MVLNNRLFLKIFDKQLQIRLRFGMTDAIDMHLRQKIPVMWRKYTDLSLRIFLYMCFDLEWPILALFIIQMASLSAFTINPFVGLIYSYFYILSMYIKLSLSFYLSLYLSIYLPIILLLSIFLSIHVFIHLSFYLSIHLPIYPSIHLSIYPSIHLSISR